MSNHYSFDRYEISDLNQINIIFKNKGSGIYILKFSDGSYYVGQTVNFSQRFYQHIHGNKHHKSWHDIVAISIFNSPIELLDFHERQVIQILKHKNLKLRNKTFNFDYAGPSKLDCQIQIANRTHWINSTHPIDLIALKTQSNRLLNKTPKLLSSRIGSENLFSSGPNSVPISVAQATIPSVSYIMELIPNLSQNEMAYWTITDYPETAGGRLITLNVGKLEVFYIPRKKYLFKNKSGQKFTTYAVHLNFLQGTFPHSRWELFRKKIQLTNLCIGTITNSYYPSVTTDTLVTPLSDFYLHFESWHLDQALRKFIIQLMINGGSEIFTRFHSPELACLAYKEIIKRYMNLA